MPYADLETRKAFARHYYSSDDQKQKQAQGQIKRLKQLYETGICRACRGAARPERTMCELCAKEQADYARERYSSLRKAVWEHYGAQCSWCGEDDSNVLEMDHINNDGKEHRKRIGEGASALYAFVVRNHFPDGFQLLCTNCNTAKERKAGGVCPPWRHNKYTKSGQAPDDGDVVSCST